ncbi:hypothetical protein E2C01_030131 [Portunus trituberculatus]|uniref:Uncharacterized protein n=1 Tax=Portunus trituberculatus TaxID=210409 RepID=A0A5B7EWH6_PORTR|nr:hypothetical protein [Portunus trituberculatus]
MIKTVTLNTPSLSPAKYPSSQLLIPTFTLNKSNLSTTASHPPTQTTVQPVTHSTHRTNHSKQTQSFHYTPVIPQPSIYSVVFIPPPPTCPSRSQPLLPPLRIQHTTLYREFKVD